MSMVRRSPYWKPGYENGRATRHSESEFLCQHLKEKNWPGIHNWHFKWKRSQFLLYLNIITFFNLFILYWNTDFLEEGLATYSSILAWRIPWTEEPGGLQSKGLQSWTRPKWLNMHTLLVNNVVTVSGGQQRNSAVCIYVSILPQTPLPSRLLHNTEQSSLCYTVGPCQLSVLYIAVCTCPSQIGVYCEKICHNEFGLHQSPLIPSSSCQNDQIILSQNFHVYTIFILKSF